MSKYGKFLKFEEKQDIESMKLEKKKLKNLKRADTLLDLAFSKHFLNYADWQGDKKNETP